MQDPASSGRKLLQENRVEVGFTFAETVKSEEDFSTAATGFASAFGYNIDSLVASSANSSKPMGYLDIFESLVNEFTDAPLDDPFIAGLITRGLAVLSSVGVIGSDFKLTSKLLMVVHTFFVIMLSQHQHDGRLLTITVHSVFA